MFGDTDASRDEHGHDEAVGPRGFVDDLDDEAQQESHGGTGAEDAPVPVPPVTGDAAVDEAMMQLARSQAGSFAERIESGEHAHRSLQSRLGGLGGA
ncbi:hypothetical protein [Terrabacter terrigena]|uniref:Uncharacterized protein n=1 Tax=Terrabacter terrigena TaxID=574718 RepID=A0ABW3MW29_9MICO